MARKSKAKFKMKGHTLPGINQKSETPNLKDGRSPSSAFQMEKESPNKIVGLAAGALLGQTKFGKNIMEKGKNMLGGVAGKLGIGGGLKEKMAKKVDEKVDETVEEALEE
tara:strand:+ start:163 stop:492 length:330 start_codon:yes stop_codon:yes gene_type:complete